MFFSKKIHKVGKYEVYLKKREQIRKKFLTWEPYHLAIIRNKGTFTLINKLLFRTLIDFRLNYN